MAELKDPVLFWTDDKNDPGYRNVDLPAPLPEIGDDFDWKQRDFESFRDALWNELKERFPERKHWTPGDMETVLIEVIAAVIDQLSDMADRVSAEAYLETARQTGSVLKWLDFIGYNPIDERPDIGNLQQLLDLYREKPHELERDRQCGPSSIRRQRRMVSLGDYVSRLEDHPLVLRAHSTPLWNGSWLEIHLTVGLWNDWHLNDRLMSVGYQLPGKRKDDVTGFHKMYSLREPEWENRPAIHILLLDYICSFRMAGQQVFLNDIIPVGIYIGVCITVQENYFQSEVRREVENVLGRGPEGFFCPGRLAFGQDIQLSDIYQYLMILDGVQNVTLTRFGKTGTDADIVEDGKAPQKIPINKDELAVCNLKGLGRLDIRLCGGRKG